MESGARALCLFLKFIVAKHYKIEINKKPGEFALQYGIEIVGRVVDLN